jgi:hypothetical protein
MGAGLCGSRKEMLTGTSEINEALTELVELSLDEPLRPSADVLEGVK